MHRILAPRPELPLELSLGLEHIEGVAEDPSTDGSTGAEDEIHWIVIRAPALCIKAGHRLEKALSRLVPFVGATPNLLLSTMVPMKTVVLAALLMACAVCVRAEDQDGGAAGGSAASLDRSKKHSGYPAAAGAAAGWPASPYAGAYNPYTTATYNPYGVNPYAAAASAANPYAGVNPYAAGAVNPYAAGAVNPYAAAINPYAAGAINPYAAGAVNPAYAAGAAAYNPYGVPAGHGAYPYGPYARNAAANGVLPPGYAVPGAPLAAGLHGVGVGAAVPGVAQLPGHHVPAAPYYG
ncbi:Acidic phosphoprotein [Frankliniella fusca]|uniref:Acidic phosphoprotein n=1 Tax=Frankliniella fusca TaxID=407009 RepID=A0AAE1I0Q0_9NEOP|nr:Acidic phosphoprotein [Frankliniella fusca]